MQILADLLNMIPAINPATALCAQRHIDGLLKPVGSLGKLEALAIQPVETPRLNGMPHVGKKVVLVMCADHDVWEEGVAISPKEVIAIQAENMTHGTAGVCVPVVQAGANVHVIDIGIDTAEPIPGLTNMRVARGSGNIASAPAMSRCQAGRLPLDVICYTRELTKNGVMLSGAGKLGMANTTPAAAIANAITGWDPEEVVEIGANLPIDKLVNKIDVVRWAIALNQPNPQGGVDVLAKVGGFDLIGVAGVTLGAAFCGLPVLLDGFLSYAAALVVCQVSPAIKLYPIPSHLSVEKGACIALSYLELEPYPNIDMCSGEGSGAVLAMSTIEVACVIYNNTGELAASNIVLPGNTTSDLNS